MYEGLQGSTKQNSGPYNTITHYAKLITILYEINIYLAEESKKKSFPEKCDVVAIVKNLLKCLTTCETEAKRCIKY